MKKTLIGLAVAALAAAAFATTTSARSAAACIPGVKMVGGVGLETFCGPATASVKIGGTSVAYKNGRCSHGGARFTINIGTVVLGKAKKKPEYFATTLAAKPGTHSNTAVAVVHGNKIYAVFGTVTLKPGLKSGTFSGKVFGLPTTVAGSFRC